MHIVKPQLKSLKSLLHKKNVGIITRTIVTVSQKGTGVYEYRVTEVHSVYDGDTCCLSIDLGLNVLRYKQTIRLLNVNTPELRGVSDEEKQKGLEARDWLRNSLDSASELIIKTHKDKTGKYGRLLGELYADGVNLNNRMLELGLAVPYGE